MMMVEGHSAPAHGESRLHRKHQLIHHCLHELADCYGHAAPSVLESFGPTHGARGAFAVLGLGDGFTRKPGASGEPVGVDLDRPPGTSHHSLPRYPRRPDYHRTLRHRL